MSGSFTRDRAKVAQLAALFETRRLAFADLATDFLDQLADVLPIVVHEGDTVLDEACLESIDVFTGDLTVRRLLDAKPMDGNYGAMTIVLGNLHVGSAVWDGGPLFVGGDLTIDRVGYFTSDGFGLFVGRDLRADVLVQEDGGVEVGGETRCRVDYRRGQDASAFLDSLTYEVTLKRRALDRAFFAAAIRAGEPVLADLSDRG